MEENQVFSSSFNYKDFPSYICVSLSNKNESELTHGIPNEICFESGDLVSVDVACFLKENEKEYHADAAITAIVGTENINEQKKF
uniref:Peptidase M24 domain-containing protein n=1 Tax=Meloidogyne enterolobii TaxID=390850 RepID=A0A6V7UWJ0_MELEN|nr:unnamed protein product [Meloidogyne enterolobii]